MLLPEVNFRILIAILVLSSSERMRLSVKVDGAADAVIVVVLCCSGCIHFAEFLRLIATTILANEVGSRSVDTIVDSSEITVKFFFSTELFMSPILHSNSPKVFILRLISDSNNEISGGEPFLKISP